MVKHLFVPVDEDKYNYLLKFKGDKTWLDLIEEAIEIQNPLAIIYQHAEIIKAISERFVKDKDKRMQIDELASTIQTIIEELEKSKK